MQARIVTPAPASARTGNRVTALRWAAMLRSLGWHVCVSTPEQYAALGDAADADALLIALHAVKSHAALMAFRKRYPDRPTVLGLAGTDLLAADEPQRRATLQRSLAAATRIVALQAAAIEVLPPTVRARAHVIPQSCVPPDPLPPPRTDRFEVCVVGHLRAVKAPMLCAAASRLLPADSRVHVVHVGSALEEAWYEAAWREMGDNPRYRWVGALSRRQTLHLIARARVLVLTSHAEGGANVVSEALMCRTPVLSTKIAGSVGMLGADYPGYFPVDDAGALATLLRHAETEPAWLEQLLEHGGRVRDTYAPPREAAAWAALLSDLGPR